MLVGGSGVETDVSVVKRELYRSVQMFQSGVSIELWSKEF
jgi:hypothetical protein